MVAPGGFTSQQSTGAIVRIANLESLEVEADVNESTIARLEIGQPAVVKVDAVPDRPYRGALRQIVPTGDRQRGTVQVKVTIEDRDARLVPDMSCAVTFLEPGTTAADLAAAPTVLVPRTAVLELEGRSAVFVVEQNRLRRVEVTLGAFDQDQVAVVSGLAGGETLVEGDLQRRRDGERVRVAT
jgi:RND family efflux transporter MFP subunit